MVVALLRGVRGLECYGLPRLAVKLLGRALAAAPPGLLRQSSSPVVCCFREEIV